MGEDWKGREQVHTTFPLPRGIQEMPKSEENTRILKKKSHGKWNEENGMKS